MAIFHWVTAALVIIAYVISESGPDIRKDPPFIHILLGLSVLTLTLPRLFWRLLRGVPIPLSTVSQRLSHLARVGHTALYLLLFIVPLTGWLTLSRLGLQIKFGGINLPGSSGLSVGKKWSFFDQSLGSMQVRTFNRRYSSSRSP